MVKAVLVNGLVILSLVSMASAAPGTASFSPRILSTACYAHQDQGTMIAAASDPIFNNGAACGRMYRITCEGSLSIVPVPCRNGNVTIKVVDRCPSPGCRATFDLSQEAFSAIADPAAGIVLIDYVQVDACGKRMVKKSNTPSVLNIKSI